MATQLQIARAGTITDQVKSIAETENLDARLVRDELAAGRLIIPANKLHLKTNLKPTGIGRLLTTKVNANIGKSSVRSRWKLKWRKCKSLCRQVPMRLWI